jgi:Plavaka transposase
MFSNTDRSGSPRPTFLAQSPKRWWVSRRNRFSLWRRYYGTAPPLRDPEESVTSEDLDDSLPPKKAPESHKPHTNRQYGPFDNISSLLLADFWWNSENEKSKNEFSKLLKVLQDPSFSLDDVVNADWGRLERTLGDQDDDDGWFDDAGWTSTPINIPVPFHKSTKNPGTERHLVGILQHRRIVAVIEEKIRNSKDPSQFHYQPYEVFWNQGDSEDSAVRVQGELYNSPAFMEAHQRIQDLPPTPGCDRERVVIALMFWSDETQLTSFGSAKLWPCYMFFGNESKYRRGKTSLRLCEHIAYFETVSEDRFELPRPMSADVTFQLSDDFKDYLRNRNQGKLPPKDFMTHCGHEIFHEQWRILLDDELLQAMEHGIVLMCHDGIERRFFPVPFTYSADYPEKCVSSVSSRSQGLDVDTNAKDSDCHNQTKRQISMHALPHSEGSGA